MELHPVRVDVEVDGRHHVGPVGGDGTLTAGPVELDVHDDGRTTSWRLANRGDRTVRIRYVRLVHRVEHRGALRFLRQGYQSWSRTAVATLGVDRDPSTTPGSLEMMQGIHHADQRRAAEGELRSEWVTVLADDGDEVVLAGFDAGVDHDGTWRLSETADGVELAAEAFLGDAALAAGAELGLHPFRLERGDDASDLLDAWARRAGAAGGARIGAAYQVGWCSWYHYFHAVTEAHLDANLAHADRWPFEVFQLDDGYQAAIGDWLDTNTKFPSDLSALAARIAATGRRPGIWLAPFIAAPDSRVATEHPEWLARAPGGQPLWGMFNPSWGGGRDGIMYALDTTDPEVLSHLERVAGALIDAGFTYLKLDFTFAPSFDGTWTDPSRTPAQRVRAGYAAVRRGAGEDAFLLGCGAPLSHVVGVVDGNRIGPDVAPSWLPQANDVSIPGYRDVEPSTLHAWVDTLARSFMHRRLWLNDPDCLMLRTDATQMTADAVRTWAHAVAVSGGMALVSDDLALLDDGARRLLDDVIAVGRAVDAAALTGAAPRCDDLMDTPLPHRLRAAGYALEGDPESARSTLQRPA